MGNCTMRDVGESISERAWLAHVVQLLRLHGWLYYHTWRSDHSPAGFPDLIAVRGGRLLAAELKRERGRLTAAQAQWRDALMAAGIEWHLWRPSDRDAVLEALR